MAYNQSHPRCFSANAKDVGRRREHGPAHARRAVAKHSGAASSLQTSLRPGRRE
jgi:hypothetical protein